MKAAILTAGAAPRLRPYTDTCPKALLPVAGVPILRRTIGHLLAAGVDQLVIGTGYRAPQVREAVAAWFPGLEVAYVDNPEHATTFNAYSLAQLAPHLAGEPFVLVDDDVVFEEGVFERLFERGLDTVAVRSVGGVSAEEVKVIADDEDRVVRIGFDLPLRGAGMMGESVGVALFSGDTSRRLFEALARRVARDRHEAYEGAIQEVVDGGATLYAVDIGRLYALGIDTEADLQAAEQRLRGDLPAVYRIAV